MPDKIWLHKDTKYSTGDTVCGYQYKFLAENEGIENFVEYTRTDAFIAKACDAYCAICDTKECDGCAECAWVIKFRRQLLKY